MKRKQFMAILLSAVLAVSTCVTTGGIGALAAENAEAGESAQESGETAEIADSAEQEEEPVAEETDSFLEQEEELADAVADQEEEQANAAAEPEPEEEITDAAAEPEEELTDAAAEPEEEIADAAADQESESEEAEKEVDTSAEAPADEHDQEQPAQEEDPAGTAVSEEIEESGEEEAGSNAGVNSLVVDGDTESYIQVYCAPGEAITLSVSAHSENEIHYTWSYGYYPVGDDSASYTFIPDQSRLVYLKVTDGITTVNMHFKVWVNHLTAHPEGSDWSYKYINAPVNEPLTLKVIAEADDKTQLTYEWMESDDGTDVPIEGATSSSYTIPSVAYKETEYVCIVRDQYNNEVRTYFDITPVINNLKAHPEGAEEDQHSIDINAGLNAPLTLKVIATADDTSQLTYKWYSNYGSDLISGANSDTYTIPKATDNDTILVIVRDQYENEVYVNFNISVYNLVNAYPEGAEEGSNEVEIVAEPNKPLTLKAIVEASDPSVLNITWNEYDEYGGYRTVQESSSPTYTIPSVNREGRYTCTIIDPDRDIRELTFNIRAENDLRVYPAGSQDSNSIRIPAAPDTEVTLKVTAKAKDTSGLNYTWFTEEDPDFALMYGNDFTVTVGEEEVTYYCVVTDQYGSADRAYFTIVPQKAASIYPEGAQEGESRAVLTVPQYKPYTLRVITGADDLSGWNFKWYAEYGDDVLIQQGNNPAYKISSVEQPGYYHCDVTSPYGIEKTVYFTVYIIPRLMEDAVITLSKTTYTYVGAEVKPSVKVVYKGETLKNNTDYYVIYHDNIDAGTAQAEVVGLRLDGSVFVPFKINKATQSPSVSFSGVCVGKSQAFAVKNAAGTLKVTPTTSTVAAAAVSGRSIKVTGKKVGTVELTITAAGNSNYKPASVKYKVKILPAATTKLTAANLATGIKLTWAKVAGANGYIIYRNGTKIKTITSGTTVTFNDTAANTNGTKYTYKIYAKATTGTSTLYKSVVTYKVARPAISSLLSTASKKMTAKWGRNTKATGYQIQYGLSSSFSGARTITISGNSTISKVIGSLTGGKRYYVRVRSIKKVGTVTYYSAWSAAKNVVVKR